MDKVAIHTPFIRLAALLKYASVCSSGGEAKIRIAEGDIAVNGERCAVAGKKIYPGDTVTWDNKTIVVKRDAD